MPLPRAFLTWVSSRLFSNLAKQMLGVVVAWKVYELTRSPLALGLLGLVEALPFMGVSLLAGTLVDRHEKRRFMQLADAGFVAAAGLLLFMTRTTHPPVIGYYVVIACLGLCGSLSMAASSAYLQSLIPRADFPRAAAWNLVQYQSAFIGGPILGGWLLSLHGERVATGLAAAFWLLAIAFSSTLRRMPIVPHPDHAESTWKGMLTGLRFIRKQPLILGPMMMDMVAVLFADTVALFPIFADRLGAGPVGLGLLKAAPALGAGLLSIAQTFTGFIRPSWRWLKRTILVFACCIIAFAFSPTLPLAVFFLAVGGMADGLSVIIRQSLYQALTPDHLRGRVTAVNGIFVTSSNEIGAFESGLAANLFGLIPAVVGGAVLTLLSVFVVGRIFGDLDQGIDKELRPPTEPLPRT